MKKLITLAIICLTALPSIGVCQSFTAGIYSKYVALIGQLPHDKPVLQANLNYPLPAGFYANLWASSGFDAKNNFGKEIDYQIGYTFKPSSYPYPDAVFDISISYFDLDKLFNTTQADVIQPNIEYRETLSYLVPPVVASLTLSYFYITRDVQVNSAFVFRYSLDFIQKIQTDFHFPHISGWLLYDGGVFGHSNQGFVGNIQADYQIPVGGIKITPLIRASLPFKNVEGKESQIVFGIKVDL